MPRTVSAEQLDGLPAGDARAIGARRDLRRVHRVMGTRRILVRALRERVRPRRAAPVSRILELGAGDGSLMLEVARAMHREWRGVHLTLLDRLNLIDAATIDGYAELGWRAQPAVADVLDWAAGESDGRPDSLAAGRWDLIVANLFVHHFEGAPLAALLTAIAGRAERFLACEPRRGWLALGGSHLIGALGVNAVTRTDAVLSVQAGFRDGELTALWPAAAPFTLKEYAAGLFSHCFYAERS